MPVALRELTDGRSIIIAPRFRRTGSTLNGWRRRRKGPPCAHAAPHRHIMMRLAHASHKPISGTRKMTVKAMAVRETIAVE